MEFCIIVLGCCFYNILPVSRTLIIYQFALAQPIQYPEAFFITDIVIQQEAEKILFIILTTKWTVLLKIVVCVTEVTCQGEELE